MIAAVFGAVRIGGDVHNVGAFGRDLQLARLNGAVVKLTQNLEEEGDLSAAWGARVGTGPAGSVPVTLPNARLATDASVRTVRADATGVGAGYPPTVVQDLNTLLASVTNLGDIRNAMSSRAEPAGKFIEVYTSNMIGPANTFSAAVGGGTNDAFVQGIVTTLAALLGAENEESVQRAILAAALSAQPPVLTWANLASLTQALQQEEADLADFNASTSTAEQQLFSSTVSGPAVDQARAQENLAEAAASVHPSAPLTPRTGLDAATWYRNMSTTIGDMRQVADQLAGQITARANTLKSNASRSLLLAGIVTFLLLALVLLLAIGLARGRSL